MASIVLSLAKRFGLSEALVEFIATFLLLFGFALGCMWLHHHVYHQGEVAADTRNAAMNKTNSDRANAERDKLNAQISIVQSSLDEATSAVSVLQEQLKNEKANSSDYQHRIAVGEQRLSVLVRQRPADPNQAPESGTVGGLGAQPSVTADLDPAVGAGLIGLTSEGDVAIIRLNACILRFDALKAAVDSMP